MKASREEVKNAVLFFAKQFGQEENYKALMGAYSGFPKIVEMIVYEMFLNTFNSYYCGEESYKFYKILFEYATELKEVGYVKHETE